MLVFGSLGKTSVEYITGKMNKRAANDTASSVDNTRPTVTITTDTTNPTNAEKITYTFKWNKFVKDFTAEDIYVNNGTKGELINILDIDGNGKIDEYDAYILLQSYTGKYDFNNDGVVDKTDADLIAKYTACAAIDNILEDNDKDGKIDYGIKDENEDGAIDEKDYEWLYDINDDSQIDSIDAEKLMQIFNNVVKNGDLDGNNEIDDTKDSAKLAQIINYFVKATKNIYSELSEEIRIEIEANIDDASIFNFDTKNDIDKEDVKLLFKYAIKDLEDIEENIISNIEIYGDINKDDKIDLKDVLLLTEIMNSKNDTESIVVLEGNIEVTYTNYDFNGNGIFDYEDIEYFCEKILAGIDNAGYIYKMVITPDIEQGNVGELSVIVEEGVCSDLEGNTNIRGENVITVDKRAPILQSLEATAKSNITLNEEIDVIKEYYKADDTIVIKAIFDEGVIATEIPTLNLEFSESGNAKNQVEAKIEGNEIIYTYTIAEDDKGEVSIKSLSGKVKDIAGNETEITRKNLDKNNIEVDTTIPELKELNVITNEGAYKEGDIIEIEAIFSEEVFDLKNNMISNIASETAPTLMVKFGENGVERETAFSKYGTKEDGSIDRSRLIYTYTITGEQTKTEVIEGEEIVTILPGDNGELSIISFQNKENTQICDIAANECTLGVNQTGNAITADTGRPQVIKVEANVTNPIISNTEIYYKEGNQVKITLTFDEEVSSDIIPEILVGFSENGEIEPTQYNTYAYESDWNVNTTTVEFTYTIKAGDNGYLWVKVPENQFNDKANNGNVSKEGIKLNVFADTILPTITLIKDTDINQENQTITVNATFSENVYDLNNNTRVSLTTANAPKLIYSFGNGNNKEIVATSVNGAIITYVINKDPVNDNGTLHCELAKGNLCDRAGNEYYSNTADTTAPELERINITSNAEYTNCKVGTQIFVTATFNEKLSNQNMKLKVRIGEGEEKEISGSINSENTKQIVYTYTVQNGDNGEFKILDITGNTSSDDTLEDKTYGYARDLFGNQVNIYNLEGYPVMGYEVADTTAPTLTITSDVEKTNKEIVTYTFTWSEEVEGFSIDDIELTNGLKGEFQEKENRKEYTLKVDSTAEGRQIIKVSADACIDFAGNSNQERVTYNKVTIDYTEPVIRVKNNGGTYVIDTDSKKSLLKETVIVNEELSNFEYIWTTSATLPTAGWKNEDVSGINVASNISLSAKTSNEGTVYLYIRVTDVAGNVTTAKTKGFVVKNSSITLTPNITEVTNKDVEITVNYGEGLTEDLKAGMSGKTLSADSSKIIATENGVAYAEAKDKFGNKVYNQIEINNIQKTEETYDNLFNDITVIEVNGVRYVKVSPKMTTESLAQKMNQEILGEKVLEYKNLTEENKLKTGSQIVIDGEIEYVVIVKGDVNCDGEVTFLGDIVMANNYRIGLITNLSTIQILAADINNNEEVDFIPDIVAMNNYRLEKIQSL